MCVSQLDACASVGARAGASHLLHAMADVVRSTAGKSAVGGRSGLGAAALVRGHAREGGVCRLAAFCWMPSLVLCHCLPKHGRFFLDGYRNSPPWQLPGCTVTVNKMSVLPTVSKCSLINSDIILYWQVNYHIQY